MQSKFNAFFILGTILSLLPAAEAHAEAPEWFSAHLEQMVAGEGRWVTDNSAYMSEQEPFDEYGLEWRWGLGKASVTGRLFGLNDGEEQGTFWQFRVFWHPGEGRAHIYQWGGNGAIAMGHLYSVGSNRVRLEQELMMPDGSVRRIGHDTVHEPGVQDGRSYNISADGTWKEDRHYVWHLKRAE